MTYIPNDGRTPNGYTEYNRKGITSTAPNYIKYLIRPNEQIEDKNKFTRRELVTQICLA